MNYTLILQNNITKEISQYNLLDLNPSSVYFKFEIELKDQIDGEYEYILFPNEEMLPVSVNKNNIFDNDFIYRTILVTYGETLTTDTQILSVDDELEIEITSFGLLRIGDYKTDKMKYNKPSNYIVYERN